MRPSPTRMFDIARSGRAAALVLLLNTAGSAATVSGQVVAVADGDTVTVLDAGKMQHKVRLTGIDAPERCQRFGDRARQNLATLVFRKQVAVQWNKTDRYGRLVGKVTVGDVDAGLEQIRAGMAWHYKAYQREQSSSDSAAYAAAEAAARSVGIGLWQEATPAPPWDFRKSTQNDRKHCGLTGRHD